VKSFTESLVRRVFATSVVGVIAHLRRPALSLFTCCSVKESFALRCKPTIISSTDSSILSSISFSIPQSATDVTVPPVLTPPRDAGCWTDSAQPALHPPGITVPAGPPPDAPLSSSTSSSPTALPSLSRSDPGTGGGVGGGLQSRSNSSERLLEASSGGSDDYHDADGTRRARAVENQYSFYWAARARAASEVTCDALLMILKKRSKPLDRPLFCLLVFLSWQFPVSLIWEGRWDHGERCVHADESIRRRSFVFKLGC